MASRAVVQRARQPLHRCEVDDVVGPTRAGSWVTMEVNGLRVPDALLRAIESRRWPPVVSREALSVVFPEEAVWPEFFSMDDIVAVNQTWRDEDRIEFSGAPGSDTGLRPDLSLLTGELGPDQLVALSYSSHDDVEPSVVYLLGAAPGDDGARWVTVAPHVEAFLEQLDAAARDGRAGSGSERRT